MSLFNTKNDLITQARKLPKKYEEYSIDELADKYCEAFDKNNKINKDIYMSALLLRFWFQIPKIYSNVYQLGYDWDDVLYTVWECIEAACYYRAWQNPDKNTNAQACINQVIATRGVPALVGRANLQKNTRASMSLDQPISDEGESTFGDTLVDTSSRVEDGAKEIIQALVSKNRIIEAIIADKISYSDPFKHSKKTVKTSGDSGEYKYVEYSSEFWPFRVVQELNSINTSYENYFIENYVIKNMDIFKRSIEIIKKANNTKKYKLVDKSLETMKSFV